MSNLQRLQNALREAQTPALLVSSLPSVQWLTGFTGSFGAALVTPDKGIFITDSRYTLQSQEQCKDLGVRTFGSPVTFNPFLKAQVEALGITRLAFDENTVTFGSFRAYEELLKGVELLPQSDPIVKLRMVKTLEEIRRVREACALIDACMERLVGFMRPGVTEREVEWEVETFLRQHGSSPAFGTIVVSGERSARPHGTPSDKPLEVGDFVTIDMGARVEGYCSDITRTFVVGKATERQREVYAQVLKTEIASIEAIRPGANSKEIDAQSRRILDEIGLATYFGHGLGHGLGALVHDTGRLSQSEESLLEVGQIWTIEPGVYIEGFGGVRIEDDVLVTETGHEILTHFPKDLTIVG